MARMIPSDISPEVKSSAERKIFRWFKDDPGTEGWIVLHSLGIANHKTVIYGEIDFVVIAPKLGIFALEVKGGRVRREDGVWYFTNKYNKLSSKKRGPFEQANDGIFSLMDNIKKKTGHKSQAGNILFGSGAMFPDIVFEVSGTDAEQWQVFDQNDQGNVSRYIQRLSKNARLKWEEHYGQMPLEKLPDNKITKEIVNVLRGDFDKAISFATLINYSEEALVSLTREQFICLDQLEDNSRCLIEGPAGTGKTLMALEEVKRAVARGEKVAFFCFNNLLGNWLKYYFSMVSTDLRPRFVGTFHSFMYQAVCQSGMPIHIPPEEQQQFFKEEMPIMALEALTNNGIMYDKIIIDEAQDLLTPDYLDIFDAILIGGIARGKWSMFGDFIRQAIFDEQNNASKAKELVEEYTSFIKFKLKINCRNTKPIGEEIRYITGFESLDYLVEKTDGPKVQYYVYKNEEDGVKTLEDILLCILNQNILAEKITILSPKRIEASLVAQVKKIKIVEYKPDEKENVTFSTIQAFKGLENSVIILTDIETFEYEKLMYVGLSRARSSLIIIETDKAETERKKLFVRLIK